MTVQNIEEKIVNQEYYTLLSCPSEMEDKDFLEQTKAE